MQSYERRRPEQTLLYQLIEQHWPRFVERAEEQGGLPSFVVREFRGLCPNCDGRRMVERAAHLTDNVLPRVRIRQWVLSLPFELRLRLAFDHQLCRKVHAVYARPVEGFYRDRAKRAGRAGGKTGCATVIQRKGHPNG